MRAFRATKKKLWARESINMPSKFEVRWIIRHPVRWMEMMWFHLTLSGLLIAKAFIIGDAVFVATRAARAWPIILGVAAGLSIASAFAPLERRLQAFVSAVLFSAFLLRAGTYVDAFFRADLSDAGQVIALAFTVHWLILAVVAVHWVTISERVGRELSIVAGQDEGSGRGKDGSG